MQDYVRKTLCSLMFAIMIITSIAAVEGDYWADNPLNENAYEWKGPGFAQVVGVGVNATEPLAILLLQPTWLPPATVEQAYLYVALIYSGATADPVANVTVAMNAVIQGTVGPYASDFINSVWGEFWNSYRFDVTGFVTAAGGGFYTIDVSADVANAHVCNVVLVVVFSDPTASYKHIIINDGLEALQSFTDTGVNQTTRFHDVGPSFTGMELDIVVAEGSPSGEYPYLEETWVTTTAHGWGHAGNLWNSTDGPCFDDHWMQMSFAPPLLMSDVNLTVGTGDDDIGWQLAVLQAYLRDVSADSQTHPNTAVLQGAVEPIEVVVRNNGDPLSGMPETFNVTLTVTGPTPGVGTQLVTDLAPGDSATLTFTWNTAGYLPGVYQITAHADSSDAITELDEVNNYCTSPSTLRIMGPPTADADGPYTGVEGSPILFNATASTDPDGTIVLYEWDWDNDGTYDASAITPITGNVWGDNVVSQTVGLRVTDDDGLTDTATTTVTVANVPPAILTLEASNIVYGGWGQAQVDFSAAFTDPGWLDTHTALWDWGDGSPPTPGAVTEENVEPDATGTVTGSHTFVANRNYVVTLTVTDDDGGTVIQELELVLGAVGGTILPTNALTVIAPWLLLALAATALTVGLWRRLRSP